MGKVRMDERGRILIPHNQREKLGLEPQTEFDLSLKEGNLILKPLIPKPLRVEHRKSKWGDEAFLDSGEATFGD